ncbi:MAG: hypothetical protein HC915_19145 [Anaerolineae bacterium]|nr:hypothetical protein [Anaerolineae bacterium]
MVAARQDRYSAESVATLFSAAQGPVQVRLFPDRRHGTQLLSNNPALQAQIAAWLAEHFAAASPG